MADIVYSTRRSGFEPDKIYRNPRYFGAPLATKHDSVIVEGDWPAVVAAYKAAGFEVSQVSAPEKTGTQGQDDQESLIAQLKARGIDRDKRTKVETLRTLLAESLDEERQEVSDQLTELGIEHDETLTAEELRKLIPEE